MNQFVAELERRDSPRVKRRLPCSLLIGGRCHPAIVRNLSASGFFVETDADLHLGTGVIVTVSGPDGARFLLETYVPRNSALLRQPPPHGPERCGAFVEKFGS
jgi:hypothetical protein